MEVLEDPSAVDCSGGWQFSADDSRVELCADTCELAKADPLGKIEILFGCKTNVR